MNEAVQVIDQHAPKKSYYTVVYIIYIIIFLTSDNAVDILISKNAFLLAAGSKTQQRNPITLIPEDMVASQ